MNSAHVMWGKAAALCMRTAEETTNAEQKESVAPQLKAALQLAPVMLGKAAAPLMKTAGEN